MRIALVGGGLLITGALLSAQQAPPDPKDPRIGLKAGIHDAGVAARHMELVSNLPKPAGFFDPEFPAFSTYRFPLGTELFSGQATSVQVTYDHLGAPPRDPRPDAL